MKINTKKNRQGDWIAFLTGAMLNLVIAESKNGLSDTEWNLLLAGLIGGIVWFLGNRLYQWIKVRYWIRW